MEHYNIINLLTTRMTVVDRLVEQRMRNIRPFGSTQAPEQLGGIFAAQGIEIG